MHPIYQLHVFTCLAVPGKGKTGIVVMHNLPDLLASLRDFYKVIKKFLHCINCNSIFNWLTTIAETLRYIFYIVRNMFSFVYLFC